MKWMSAYLIGYFFLLIGLIAALWKTKVLDRLGTEWTVILVVIALGIGIMASVANSGRKGTIEIDNQG